MSNKKLADFPAYNDVLTHIFKDQLEWGLDYLYLLVHAPNQNLPVIILYGEPQSGKSSFLYLVSCLTDSTCQDSILKVEDVGKRCYTFDGISSLTADEREMLKLISSAYRKAPKLTPVAIVATNVEPRGFSRGWPIKTTKCNMIKGLTMVEQLINDRKEFIEFLKERGCKSPAVSRIHFPPFSC